jgi:hypothetical protein
MLRRSNTRRAPGLGSDPLLHKRVAESVGVSTRILASLNTPLSARCRSPVALSRFDSPDQKKYPSLTFGTPVRIGDEMWHSWGKLHSREGARSTRAGEGRNGQNVASRRPPPPLHSPFQRERPKPGIPAAKPTVTPPGRLPFTSMPHPARGCGFHSHWFGGTLCERCERSAP